ncbi:MAG: hydroxyacid dehydrogenase [Christensenellaceae bacterium]|nr:hydroxyacid dehydrogenase [Christensenellaceae bacterium]
MENTVFLCNEKQNIHNAYTEEQIGGCPVISTEELKVSGPLKGVTTVFSTWGMPAFSEEEAALLLPDLKEIYYAAGTVQQFARPYMERGVRIFSAWAANAVPVAEFTLGQILLSNKGYFQLVKRYREEGFEKAGDYGGHFMGNYNNRVGLIGAGMVGKKVIENLKPFDLEVWVFDPFLPDEKAEELGVRKTTLEDIFMNCPVISNHLANNAETKGMIDYRLLSMMSPYAVFINTGRGAQVVTGDLVRAMREEPGRTALIDVTDPAEPLPEGHEFFSVPNILVTPHRAGSQKKEIFRMGAYMMEEMERVRSGKAPLYEVTLDMLKTMA